MRHRAALIAALVALFAFGAVLAAPNAQAHASLRSSEPARGDQIAAAPDAVLITFTEEPEISLSSIRVLDATGAGFEDGKPSPAPGDPLTLRTSVKAMGQGVYTVLWRVVSRVDGHATAGSFAFGVGVSPAGAPPPRAVAEVTVPERSSLEMTGRLLLFAGFVALIGGAWFGLVALARSKVTAGLTTKTGRRTGGDTARRDRRLLAFMTAGWVAALAGVPLLAEAQRRAADTGFADLASTSLGSALIWRGIAILVAGAGLAIAVNASGGARRAGFALSGIAATVAAFVHVRAGHASAASSPTQQVIGQTVHVVAVSLWVGGFGALLATIRGAAEPEKWRAVKRYSTTAAVALFVVLATGVARSLTELDGLGNLTSTGYGRAVLIKIGVFALLAVLGGVNRFRNVAKARTTLTPIRRIVKFEAGLAVVALVAAAVLASLAPPGPAAEAAATPKPEQLVVSGSDFATSVRTRVTIEPGYAGPNTVTAALADFDSGEPITDAEVSIRFAYQDDTTIPASVALLDNAGDGTYTAQTANFSLEGRWRLTVLVQRGADSIEIPLTVATRCRVTATPAAGQPTLYDAQLPEGRSVQMYADAAGGKTEVHVTLFDANGTETFVRSVGVLASRGGGEPQKLPHRRFSDGHFIASGELAPATWRFDVGIATPDGTFKACFEETIGE